jgi:signal transduction histidine kinase
MGKAALMTTPDMINISIAKDSLYWRLLIRRLALFAPLLLSSGVFAYWTILDIRLEEFIKQMNQRNTQFISELSQRMGADTDRMRWIYDDIQSRELLKLGSQIDQNQLTKSFKRYFNHAPHLYQLRWVNTFGKEKIKIVRKGTELNLLPKDELEDKSYRHYMKAAKALKSGQIYVSAINLNVENKQIEEPHIITFRTVIYTDGPGMTPGYLIANYSLNTLFDQYAYSEGHPLYFYLVDDDGFWLAHPDADMRWGAQLDHPEHNIQFQHPMVWANIHNPNMGSEFVVQSRIWSYASLKTALDNLADAHENNLYIIGTSSTHIYTSIRNQTVVVILVILALITSYIVLAKHRIVVAELLTQQLYQQLQFERQALETNNQELNNALNQQQELQDELVETRKLSSLGMMVAGVAHELNTPIGAALITITTQQDHQAQIETLMSTGITRSALESFLASNKNGLSLSLSNLQRCANLLQSFKRLAVDRSDIQIETFELNQVINDIINSMHSKLKRKSTVINIEGPSHIELHSYPGIFSQIFQNLIDNALSHGFKHNQNAKITIHLEQKEADLVVKFSDNGSGISDDIIDSIFDPFVTTNRGKGNIGLGMHLVHQWVTQLLKGHIHVHNLSQTNNLNPGAQFIIIVPINLNPPTNTTENADSVS